MPTILGATYGLFNFKSAEKNEPNTGSDKEEDDKWIQIPPSLLWSEEQKSFCVKNLEVHQFARASKC